MLMHLIEPEITVVIPKAYASRVIDRRLLGGFTGVYEAEDGSRITVFSTGEHLFFTQSPAGYGGDQAALPRFVMFPLSDNAFFCKEIDCQLEFGNDVHGEVCSLKVTYNGEQIELRRKD